MAKHVLKDRTGDVDESFLSIPTIVTEDLMSLIATLNGHPRLLTRAELAKTLSASTRHVDRLRKRGLPSVPLGKNDLRFDYGACVAWLKTGEGIASKTARRGRPRNLPVQEINYIRKPKCKTVFNNDPTARAR